MRVIAETWSLRRSIATMLVAEQLSVFYRGEDVCFEVPDGVMVRA